MKFKIVGDSCCDFTRADLTKEYVEIVPLTLTIGDEDVVDDESFEQRKFIEMVESCPACPKSSCPSPEAYLEKFSDAENIYVVTLSSKLSGSFNSAVIAKEMYGEKDSKTNIHVFDSKSAAAGQHLIYEKIEELALRGLDFANVVKSVNDFIESMKTIFVLENLEVMKKNGRLTKIKSFAADVLNIKPVLHAVDGEIHQLDKGRGMNKALEKLLYQIKKQGYDRERKVAITQCDSYARCEKVKNILIENLGFKKVEILDAGGVSSMYESRGGVVVAF